MGSRLRDSARSAVTTGAYGSSPSPSSTQSPLSTRAPDAFARPAISESRRVLPTPESPATNTSHGLPAPASTSAAPSRPSPADLPTNFELLTRVATNQVSLAVAMADVGDIRRACTA